MLPEEPLTLAPAVDNHELLDLLRAYKPSSNVDAAHQSFILTFVATHTNPFSRAHLHAHLTASALVINRSATMVLLGYHRKLGMWLQFGGHGEPGESDPAQVALREAREESGIATVELHPAASSPYDLDVHTIPARPDVPEHLHLDIRFLAIAADESAICHQVEEQEEVRWFSWEETAGLALDESLRRMILKARDIISALASDHSELRIQNSEFHL